MPDRDYSHRLLVDKLGIRAGHAVAFEVAGGDIDGTLREEIAARTGRGEAEDGQPVDVVVASIDSGTDVVGLLMRWRARIRPDGGIWLLSPKRGMVGYVKQEDLIPAGQEARLVDNKICSVSERQSGMRFVIRRRDRER